MVKYIETVMKYSNEYINDVAKKFRPNAFPLSEINNNNPFVENVLRNGKEMFSISLIRRENDDDK
jgi:hypothetical protein